MPTLPIPVFIAAVLLFLFLRLWAAQGRIGPLAILLAACMVQALIIALALHYHLPGMRQVRPVTAAMLPGIAWLAFQVTAVRALRQSDLMHLAVPVLAVAALFVAPDFLDVLLPGSFVAYGVAILVQARYGPDAQPRMSLENGELPSRIWIAIGAMLIASAVSDALILSAQAMGADHLRGWIVSIFSAGSLLAIGALSLSEHLRAEPDEVAGPEPAEPEADSRIWEQIERYMEEKRPYLDPDLTLAKLSRKLGVPAKLVSATINRATKGNVSRYVNDARIEAAKRKLLAGESVTEAMLGAGFNTKSNFNREFLRVTGSNPSVWLAAQRV